MACSHCTQAKQLLDSYYIKYDEVFVDVDQSAREFMVSNGHRTVPQFYENGKLVVRGGYNELSKLSAVEITALLEKLNAS